MQGPLNVKNRSSELTCRCYQKMHILGYSVWTDRDCECVLDYRYGCNTLTWIEYRGIYGFALPPETLISDECIRLGFNVVSLDLWLPTLRRKYESTTFVRYNIINSQPDATIIILLIIPISSACFGW